MINKLSITLAGIVLLAFAGCASTPEQAPAPAPAPAAPKATPPAPPPAAAAPAASKPEKVTTASTVNFDFDRYVIRPDARTKLDDLVGKLRNVTLEVVIAVGHADRLGGVAYNMKLSVRRADSVKAYLVSKGIPSSKVTTIGKGETQPVATNKTKEGRQKNRRVDIEFKGVKQ